MRLFSFAVLLLILWLATCSGPMPESESPPPTAIPTQTSVTPTLTAFPATPTETLAPQLKLPAAPFDARTYLNEEAGFAFDFPSDWTFNESVAGSRGTQTLFVSKPELAEAGTIPADEVRLSATIYQWDPKNDLAAYAAHWEEAWTNSGFNILDEQQLTLELGLPAVEYTLQTPDAQAIFLVTALDDQYLVLAGEGNLDLVKQVMQRLRPISD